MVVERRGCASVGTEPVPGPDGAVVTLYELSALTGPRASRARPPRRIAVERVVPGGHVVVGRRGSPGDPPSAPDGDGVRVTVDQRVDPLTSRRHVELVHRKRWMLQILDTVKHTAGVRAWGSLAWDEAPPGTRLALEAGRPVAIRLPGSPGFVVTFVTTATQAPSSSTADPESTTDVGGPSVPAVELTPGEQSAIGRIYRAALQWPPSPNDDPAPSWAQLQNDESLRRMYKKVRDKAEVPLQLARRPGPDELLLARLIASNSFTYEVVAGIADACDLPLEPPYLY